MEVLNNSDSPVLISNAEVLKMLNESITERKEKEDRNQKKRRRNHTSKFQHLEWIEDHVQEYLQSTPCVQVDTSHVTELKSKFMASKKSSVKTTGFALTEAESIQLLNFMPQEPVEIHLMVEELHARMSEKGQEDLLELIGSYRKDRGTPTTTTTSTTTATTENGTSNPEEEIVDNEAMEDVVEENGDATDAAQDDSIVKQEV
jgi:spore coat protein CotF